MSRDNRFYIGEPAKKKLKVNNFEHISLSFSISQEKPYDTMEGEVSSEQLKEEPPLEQASKSIDLAGIKVDIKVEPDEAARLEGSVTVYCCPLDGCSFTTSRQGMRDHQAATHLR